MLIALHDVENVEAFCAAVVSTVLAKKGAYLRPDRRDDARDFLVGEIGILSLRYDAELGWTFRAYAGYVLERRMDDFYRQTLGDSRAKHRQEEVSLDALDADSLSVPSHEEVVLDRVCFSI